MRTSEETHRGFLKNIGRFWLLGLVTVLASSVDGCSCGGTGTSKNKTPPNPAGRVQFQFNSLVVMEYGVTLTIEVNRISGSTGAVSVDVQFSSPNGATGGGVDYSTNPATNPISFSWNDGEVGIKTFTLTTLDDLVVDPDEIIVMTLAATAGTPTLDGPVQITIADTWIKDAGNPVIQVSALGNWNDSYVSAPFVLQGATQYEMFVSAGGNGQRVMGRYLSADGVTWGTGGPTNLTTGMAGAFDEFIDDPCVVYDGTGYQMWYTAITSLGVFSIAYATSANGQTWNTGVQVMTGSGAGWDATDVGYCHVIKDGPNAYRMWYSGKDALGTDAWAIGYAISADGTTWTPSGSNPIFVGTGVGGDFDEIDVRGPCVMDDNGTFRMFYVGWNGNVNFNHDIGFAGGSGDGITGWARHAGNPVIGRGPITSFDFDRVDLPGCIRIPGATPDQDSIVLYYEGWPDNTTGLDIEIGQSIVP